MATNRFAKVTKSNSLISDWSQGDSKDVLSPKVCRSEFYTNIEYDRKGKLLPLEEHVEDEKSSPLISLGLEEGLTDSDHETVIYCAETTEENGEIVDAEDAGMFSVHEEDVTLTPARMNLNQSGEPRPHEEPVPRNDLVTEIAKLRRTFYIFMLMSITLQVVIFTQLYEQKLEREDMPIYYRGDQYQAAEVAPVYNFWSVAFLTTMFYSKTIYAGIINSVAYFWQMRNLS